MAVNRRLADDPRRDGRIRLARVLSVNTRKFTAAIQFYDGEDIEGTAVISGAGVSGAFPSWMGGMLAKGMDVMAVRAEGDSVYRIISTERKPTPHRVDPSDINSEESDGRDDYSMGSDPVPESAKGIWGENGQRIVSYPDGTLEFYIDEQCFTRYFPDSSSIVTMAHTMATLGLWGERVCRVLREPGRDRALDTPTEVVESFRSAAQRAPVMYTHHGSIPDLAGAELAGRAVSEHAGLSGIVARWVIFDQATADAAAAQGKVPSMEAARAVVLADLAGNVQTVLAGTLDLSVGDLMLLVRGRLTIHALEAVDVTLGRALRIQSVGGVEVDATEPVIISSRSDIEVRCKRFIVRALNDLIEVDGPWKVQAGGEISLSSGSTFSTSSAADTVQSVGGSFVSVVSAAHDVLVMGQGALENRGRDVATARLKVVAGRRRIEMVNGSYEQVYGNPLAPAARFVISADNRDLLNRYRLDYSVAATQARLTLAPTGAGYMGSPKGNVRLDAAGNIQLGPAVGVAANVLTSLTTCYVTGLPFRGAPNVTVVQRGPALPGPSITFPGPLPLVTVTPEPKFD